MTTPNFASHSTVRARGALRRLVAPDGGDPGVAAGQLGAERLHLSNRAAAIGRALPQPFAVDAGLLVEREPRPDPANRQAVPALEVAPKGVRLVEEQPGVEGEQIDGQSLAPDQIDQHAPLGAESGRTGEPAPVALGGPSQHVRGSAAFVCGGNPIERRCAVARCVIRDELVMHDCSPEMSFAGTVVASAHPVAGRT